MIVIAENEFFIAELTERLLRRNEKKIDVDVEISFLFLFNGIHYSVMYVYLRVADF